MTSAGFLQENVTTMNRSESRAKEKKKGLKCPGHGVVGEVSLGCHGQEGKEGCRKVGGTCVHSHTGGEDVMGGGGKRKNGGGTAVERNSLKLSPKKGNSGFTMASRLH